MMQIEERRQPWQLGRLGIVPRQWVKHFPTCGEVQFYRGSFAWDYGTGTARQWIKTLRTGERVAIREPAVQGGSIHAAHDIHGERGSVIYAVEPGVIIHRTEHIERAGAGGWTICLYADPALGGSGRVWYYAHLDGMSFHPEGTEVEAGEHLGLMGSSGNADSVHLHLQCLLPGNLDLSCRSWGFGRYPMPVDVYDELRAALVAEQGEEVALKVATEGGGIINCSLAPGAGGGGGSGGILLGLGALAGAAWWLTRKRR